MKSAPLLRVPVLGLLLMLSGCATTTGAGLGLTADGRLSPCSITPNCVSSDAPDDLHRIKPLMLRADPQAAWQALLAYLENDSSYEIKVRKADYVRAEAQTRILGFIDDVEFHLRPAKGQIAMRSASRAGISDWGKNSRRLEAVRQALRDAQVVKN